LLDKHHIVYIVVGTLAGYLLEIPAIKSNDLDILVSKGSVKKLNTMIQREQGIDMLEPVRRREGGVRCNQRIIWESPTGRSASKYHG